MPINSKGEVWRKSRLTSGVEYPSTKEFFANQSEFDSRVSEYNSSIWNPRHELDGRSTTWSNANSAEIKALDIIKDKFHSTLTQHIVNKAHQSILPLKDLVDVISKNCTNLLKGEVVKMENGDDLILSCKVVKVHSEDSTYTINDGSREILRVPSTHLHRHHQLTPFDIESLIRLTCTQSEKDRSWQVDDAYKKEFGMKEKLAPIFCKPQNGSKKEAVANDDEVLLLPPPVKKAKRESNDSLKENGEKKEEKEKKPRKKREQNGEKMARKKPKNEVKEEVVSLDSSDDEAPLSVLANKLKDKKQKQGFLDKFLISSPSSSKTSPTKKTKGKVEKAMEPLVALYKGEDSRSFVQECDVVIKGLTKEVMDSTMDTIDDNQSVEVEILHVLLWRKAWHTLAALALKVAKDERAAMRESNRKELDAMHGKIVVEKMKERIKTAKAIKEMEEEERGEDYDKSMGKLSPPGVVVPSPHFPTALMISEFIFTRSNLFPPNYRLPMTEEIVDALSAEGRDKRTKAERVTYPIVKILMDMLLKDDRYKKYAFCNTSLAKLSLDEYSIVEMMRVIVTGERPNTKEERDRLREEKKEVKEEEKKEDEERPHSPDDTEYEEEEGEREGDVTLNEDDQVELVAALEDCEGRWDRIEGRRQGMIMEFLLNCLIDSSSFEIRTDVEVQEEHDDLKRERRETKTKMDEIKNELKEWKKKLEEKESTGVRLARSDTSKLFELEETMTKTDKRMEEISTLIKGLEKELDLAKYGSRLDPIGVDRHGRRYMLMPHYAGLLIQSTGSGEWIEDDDGSEYFGFVPSEEEWRIVMSVKEWDELSEILKNGSKSEKKLMKAMERNKEKFESGLKWIEKVEGNKKKEENADEEMEEGKEEPLSEKQALRREMISLLEKCENGELLKVKEISLLNRKTKDADSLDDWRCVLLEFEERVLNRARENKDFMRVFRITDESFMFHSFDAWKHRVRGARLSEVLLLMRVLDYRIVWNYKEIYREKEEREAKKKEEEERKKHEGEEDEEANWADRGVHTRRHVESLDKKEVRTLMKKVMDLASGRLAATLNTLESDDERLMNMKDIEEECHRYSIERLKKVLRKNLSRWRDEIESRFAHRLDQFDEFTESVHKLL